MHQHIQQNLVGGTVSHSCFRVLSSSREKRAPTTYPTVARTKIEPSVLAFLAVFAHAVVTLQTALMREVGVKRGHQTGLFQVSSRTPSFRGNKRFLFRSIWETVGETAMLIVMTFWSLFSACKVNILIENLTGQEFKLTRVQTLNPSKSQSQFAVVICQDDLDNKAVLDVVQQILQHMCLQTTKRHRKACCMSL